MVEVSGYGFESYCRCCNCFEWELPWHPDSWKVQIHSQRVCDMSQKLQLTVLKGIFCSSMKQTFIQNVCCWISSNQFDLNTINLKLYSDKHSGTYNSANIHWLFSWFLLLKKASHLSKTWQKKPRYLKLFLKK